MSGAELIAVVACFAFAIITMSVVVDREGKRRMLVDRQRAKALLPPESNQSLAARILTQSERREVESIAVDAVRQLESLITIGRSSNLSDWKDMEAEARKIIARLHRSPVGPDA